MIKSPGGSGGPWAIPPRDQWAHLWDIELGEVLVTAIGVFATGPVTVHQVMLLPEEC